MPIEIVPAGSTAVVTERHEQRHEHDKHPDRWDLSVQAEKNHAADTVQGTLTQQEVASGFAAGLVDSAKNTAALSVQSRQETDQLSNQATGNFNLASVQSTGNFNLASVQAQTIANLASVQAVQFAMAADISRQKFAYEGQLQAQTIAAAQAAKAAECCCELKSAILADGQKTRDLLNSITEQNLRDRAQRSENALAAYFAAKVAPTSPIS
jgi:hypothetical protein